MKNDTSSQCIRITTDMAKKPVTLQLSGAESSVEIVVETGVRATVFDTSTSEKHRVSVTLEKGSELHVVSLSSGSAKTFTSDIADGASIFWHCFTLHAASSPHTLVSTVRGNKAKSDVDWVFLVQGSEKQNVSIRNIFNGTNGGGEITMKGVADDKAYAACNGMIEIGEGGRGTDTYLTEDVLMLDSTAKIDAVPALEIRTNDVKASHSATVSRITAESLFYLQSRGIDEPTARTMFVDGFLSGLTERIPDETIRAEVVQALVLSR